MQLGTSIFLIALGAILKFAVTATVSGLSLAAVGVILMLVGIAGLLLSMLFLAQARRGTVVTEPVVTERVVERDPYVDPRI